jgi:hypothetical protein
MSTPSSEFMVLLCDPLSKQANSTSILSIYVSFTNLLKLGVLW